MNTFKKLTAVFVIALIVSLGLGAAGVELPVAKRADAQATSAGTIERVVPNSVTISSTAAVVCTAVSGKRIEIRGLVLNSGTAGVVMFQDGSSGNGVGGEGTTIWTTYLEANKPLTFDDRIFGPDGGPRTTAGNALYVKGPGLLTFSARCQIK